MTLKKYKKISVLLLSSMLISLLPKVAFAAGTTLRAAPVLAENTMFPTFFDELTKFINESVGNNVTDQTLSQNLENDGFAKSIAQRELIRKAGADTIQKFSSDPEKKKFILWLFNNLEAMTLFLEGGEPASDYLKAFEVWYEIWNKDPDSHRGYELKLAASCALRLGDGVPQWYTSRVLVTPYERYNYFKVREAEGKFPTSMKTRTVWEIKNTISAPVSNSDLDYVREVIHAGKYNQEEKKVDIQYPPYVFESKYKDENGNPYSVFSATGDQFYGPDATIKEVHEIGGVCGAASRFGTVVVNSFGIPGFVVGQPGHAAHVYHSPNHEGKWDLGYDIYGFGESTLQDDDEGTLVPYSNYNNTISRVYYWLVYEEARKNEATLHKSMQFKWIANALEDRNLTQKVRKIAMETNKWNIDVWRDYINSMKTYWNEELEKTKIANSSITVEASSENNPEKAENVIDGDKNTIWHTKYSGDRTYLPQWITLKFDKEYDVNRFVYVPRNGGGNGTVTKYNFYKSLDGTKFELISSGNLENNSNEKIIDFKSTNAKYLKFEVLEGEGNYATASEFRVYRPFQNNPISNQEWKEVSNSIITELADQPSAVFDLFRLIQNFVLTPETPREEYQNYIVKLNEILDKASTLNSSQKTIVEYIRERIYKYGLAIVDFNFDGDNAGKLMGSKTDTEYSLDGGHTWKSVIEDNMKLSDEEISSITSENGIKIRIKGTNESIRIPIHKAKEFPDVYVNDSMNKIFNIDEHIYYSIDEGKTWTKYEDDQKLPDLSGDMKLMMKIPAEGKTLGSEIKTFDLTSKTDDSLILPNDIIKIDANENSGNPASYAYDGNINTFWHTNYSDDKRPLPQAITFELKDINDIFKLEYTPRQDSSNNGTITKYNIYSSQDGQNFTLISNGNWTNDRTVKSALFDAKNAKFIRLEAVEGVGNYATAAEIRLYRNVPHESKVDFSFDGNNANKLMGSDDTMEYSIDNGKTWRDVTESDMTLSKDDVKSINATNGIQIRIKGSTKTIKIEVSNGPEAPNVEADDDDNIIKRLDSTMEYSLNDGSTWTKYVTKSKLKFTGDATVLVRVAGTGTILPGKITKLQFKKNKVVTEPTDMTNDVAPMVDFSFDGDNANKLIGSDDTMEYSIDGGKIWKCVSGSDMTLSEEDLASINATNGIKIRTKQSLKITEIEIFDGPEAPNVEAVDDDNIIKRLDSTMEYSVDGGKTWTKYTDNGEVKFTGDVTVLVRVASTGTTLSGEFTSLEFKENGVVTKPTDTIDTTKPTNTEDTTKPTNTEDTTKPTNTEDTTKPTNTEGTTKPKDTVDTTKPTNTTNEVVAKDDAAPKIAFSFDGNNAYKLMGADDSMEYSIDGGITWLEITESDMTLSEEDLASINATNGIKIRTKQSLKITEIKIENGPDAINVEANENIIKRLDSTMEYSVDGGKTWTRYSENEEVKFTEDTKVLVRVASTGTALPGKSVELVFNKNEAKPNNTGDVNGGTNAAKPNNTGDVNGGTNAAKPNNTGDVNGGTNEAKPNNAGDVNGGTNAAKPNNTGDVNGGTNAAKPNNTGDVNGGTNAAKPNNTGDVNGGTNAVRPNNTGDVNGGTNVERPNNSGNVADVDNIHRNEIQQDMNTNENEESLETSFSFNGNKAKISGVNNCMEYSIDGGNTWLDITENDMVLSNDVIASINAENGIQIRKKGTSKVTKIEVSNGPEAPSVEVDDTENIVKGLDSSMEYSLDGGKTWTKYSEGDEEKFTGDLNVLVRVAGDGKTLPSKSVELKFTENKAVSNKESKINPVSVATTVAIVCVGGLSIFGFRTGRIKF